MDKIAQRRKLLSKIHEATSIKGRILEKMNPEFREVMDSIRDTDARIREYAENIKTASRNARSSVRRNDYLQAAQNLTIVHDKAKYIAAELEKLKNLINKKHFNILLNKFDDDHKRELFEYDPKKIVKLETETNELIKKYAGIGDWWFNIKDIPSAIMHNLFTGKGIAMSALQKSFSTPFLKTLKTDTENLTTKTEEFVENLLDIFKKLGNAVGTRDIHTYVLESNNLIKKYAGYNRTFLNYYNKNIEPIKSHYIQLKEEMNAAEAERLKQTQQETERLKQIQQQQAATQPPANQPPVNQSDATKLEENQEIELEKQRKIQEDISHKMEEEARKQREGLDAAIKAQELKKQNPSGLMTPEEMQKKIDELTTIETKKSNRHGAALHKIAKKYYLFVSAQSPEMIELDPSDLEEIDETEPFELTNRVKPKELVEQKRLSYDLPDGKIDRHYSSIPFLKEITADRIRMTPNTEAHLVNIFVSRLEDYDYDLEDVESQVIGKKLTEEIKKAIVNGWVLSSVSAGDINNPKDKIINIYIRFNISDVMPELAGTAKIKIDCRISARNKTLTVKTINKNFRIE